MVGGSEGIPERPMFQDATVFVSTSRVRVNTTTYAMANITSVRAWKTPANRSLPIIGLVVAIGLAFLKYYIAAIVVAAICGLILYLMKDTHTILIGSSSGEVQALKSNNRAYIEQIVDAINNAIVARG